MFIDFFLTQLKKNCSKRHYFSCKCINNKRRAEENLHPLLGVGGDTVTKDDDKVEVPEDFALVFNSKTSCSLDNHSPSWKAWMGTRISPLNARENAQ